MAKETNSVIKLGVVPYLDLWANSFRATIHHYNDYHHRIILDDICFDIWTGKGSMRTWHNVSTNKRGKVHNNDIPRLLEKIFLNIDY